MNPILSFKISIPALEEKTFDFKDCQDNQFENWKELIEKPNFSFIDWLTGLYKRHKEI